MERRQFSRVPIDEPHFITVAFEDGTSSILLLVDIGKGGLQAAFSPNQTIAKKDFLGKNVSIAKLSESVKDTAVNPESLRGTVAWVSPQRCGIRFHTPLPLSDEELTSLIFEL